MANIQLTALTVGAKALVDGEYVWKVPTGEASGVLDKLVTVINDNISIQYDNGRIKDDKYADVYLGSMQTVITQSILYILEVEKIKLGVMPSTLR